MTVGRRLMLACALLGLASAPARAQESPAAELPSPPPAASPAVPDRAGYSYNYALYDGRYNDTIVSFDFYKPFGSRNARIRPFAAVAANRDSRTGTGNVPLILADNYAVGGVGLQFTNAAGLRLWAQAGASTHLGPVAAQPSGSDARGGVQYYRSFGPQNAAHHGYGNLYASTTYYSRYSDAVLYAQAEAVANAGGAVRPLEFFIRPVLTLDTKTFYYSNLFETSAGLRYHPLGTSGPVVSIEGAVGRYVRGAVRPAGQKPWFSDFRPTISYGFSL